jgi:phage replication O-like protein O
VVVDIVGIEKPESDSQSENRLKMTNPQWEDGYLKIANEIVEALAKYKIPGEPTQCLMVVLRKTYGWNCKESKISLDNYMNLTGMKKPTVCRALKWLIDHKVIIKNDNFNPPKYSFNKFYSTWEPLSKKITLSKKIISIDNNDNFKGSAPIILKKDKETTLSKKIMLKFEKKVPIPKYIFLTEEMKTYANGKGVFTNLENIFEEFHDWHLKKNSKYADWMATWRSWVRKHIEFKGADSRPEKVRTKADIDRELYGE